MDFGKVTNTNTTSYQGFGMPTFPFMPPQPTRDNLLRLPAGELVWVENEKQISDICLPPNALHIFVNKGENVFYIASTDKLGLKTISTYTFSEKVQSEAERPVTRAEFEQLLEAMKGAKTNEFNSREKQQQAEQEPQPRGIQTNPEQYGRQNPNGIC